MDHISIIIIHYNTENETRSCLESLAHIKTRGFKHTIIVVDNASKKPLRLPQTILEQGIEVIRSQANLGFTGGNNLGIRYALEHFNSEYILLLNNDTTVAPTFLLEMYNQLKNYSQAGLTSPKIYFSKGKEFYKKSYKPHQRGQVFWYAGGSIDWDNVVAFHRGVDELDRGQFDSQTHSDFATGCALLVKREVLEKIGLLDDKYFLYLEDADLSLRAKQAGYECLFCPAGVVWHDNAGSSGGSGSTLHQYYQTRNRLYFGLRYGGLKTTFVTLRLMLQLFTEGRVYRKAIIHALTGQMGKEPVI